MSLPIAINIVIGFITVSVTILIFYAGINKKLDELLHRQTLELSRTQARDLVDIYLTMTQSEIDNHIHTFHALQLARCIQEKNKDAVQSAVFARTESIITDQRNKLNSFRIKGGISLKWFLDSHLPLRTGHIALHMQKIYEICCKALDGRLTREQCESAVVREAQKGFGHSRELIKKELADIYG